MSAPRHSLSERQRLRKRADYFFGTGLRARGEVAAFANELRQLGPTVAIGGFLRDLYLDGNRYFVSDVDFVVDPGSMQAFERLATRLGARPNRFGGYGVSLGRWKADVWPLERTWAAVHGHVEIRTIEDVLDATFFDWDSVIYAVGTGRLTAGEGYFQRLRDRVIDINLEPNPNPLGNAVRALRYAYRWKAALGAKLACHVEKQLRDHGWEAFVLSERRSFARPVLYALDRRLIEQALARCVRADVREVALNLHPRQQELCWREQDQIV